MMHRPPPVHNGSRGANRTRRCFVAASEVAGIGQVLRAQISSCIQRFARTGFFRVGFAGRSRKPNTRTILRARPIRRTAFTSPKARVLGDEPEAVMKKKPAAALWALT